MDIIDQIKRLTPQQREQLWTLLQTEEPDSTKTARLDTIQPTRLVAYYVPKPNRHVAADTLRDFLRKKLPDYMLPTAFIALHMLPKTTTGKIDYPALPSEIRSTQAIASTYVAPRSALEKVMTYIWTDVLEIEQVGIVDDFFELGGHSLLVMLLISRIRETFKVAISIQAIFAHRTVESLCSHLLQIAQNPNHMHRIAELFIQIEEGAPQAVDTIA